MNTPPTMYPPEQLDFNKTSPEGDVTQPQCDIDLTKFDNGYVGRNQHFAVLVNAIQINTSDAVDGNMPSEEQRQRSVDEAGNFSQLQKAGEATRKYWLHKIGPYLADWVLHLPPQNPPWKLRKFPSGYTLWVHKTGIKTDPLNPRVDAYLYGAPHLGPRTSRTRTNSTVFRSPMEFVPHAIWLMNGRTGQCMCKYCTPNQNQNDINRRLNYVGDVPEDDDSDDDDKDNLNAASRRNTRGAKNAGAAGRTRRVRRDKTPPINIEIAKDYRVGHMDPSPTSAT